MREWPRAPNRRGEAWWAERPELLSKSVYKEVQSEFSKRLHTIEDVQWQTFPKFAQELVDYGRKFEKEQNEK